MAKFTIDGFTTQDVTDFAYSKGYQDIVDENPNPVTKGQFCKDYFKMLCRNDIKAYRLKVAKEAVESPTEPSITVT